MQPARSNTRIRPVDQGAGVSSRCSTTEPIASRQGDHGMPLDVVAHGMLEDLAQRVAVMIAEMHRL